VRHDLLAEGCLRDGAGREQLARVAQRRRQPRFVRRLVGVALKRRLQLEAALDALQPGRDQCRQRQVRVEIGAAGAVLEAQRAAVTDDPQRARAVVVAPGYGRRRERADRVAL